MLALIYKRLNEKDFKILYTLEKYMKKFEYVPVSLLERRCKLSPSELSLGLTKLNNLKLIKRKVGIYIGYQLTWRGFDVLAIRALADKNVLSALGSKIGVGKESDIYEGLAPGDKRVIVKVHRVGRISFRQTARVRTYMEKKEFMSWVEQSFEAAEREFIALNELLKTEALVPKPIGRNRHIVVIEYINGILLLKLKEAMNPLEMLENIIETLRKAYVDVGIVHGDLSAYNVMIELGTEKPYIIDWPQYVYKEHPSAMRLLERDVKYIVGFFNRRFGLGLDYKKFIDYITKP